MKKKPSIKKKNTHSKRNVIKNNYKINKQEFSNG